jgi:broad specificity phosphatase PhoE
MLTFREAIADVGEIRKKSHAKVGYQDHPNGNMQCSSCAMFSPPSNCSLVDPPIQPSGWCWEYARRNTSDMARQELARKNQPGAADVHTTTALGNEDPKKLKAKNFLSFIAEIKGGGRIVQPLAPVGKKKKDGLAKLRIVRHGATRMNNDVDTSADRIRGWMDVPLTKEGRDQAKEAGEALKDHDIEVLVASDLDRAKETADIIGDIIGVKPIYTTRLRPWDLGKFTGMSTKEAIPKMAEYVHEKYDQPVPEGESWEDFAKRAFAGIAEAFRKADGKNLAIVTHHRVERLLAGWDEADQPSDHSIDLKEFLKKGDPPGGVKVMMIDLKALNGKGGNEMGKVWDSNDELPDSVQGLPDEAKTVFRRVANDRMKNGAGDVSAIRQAWTAVKNGWKKQGEEWVRKFAGDEESLEVFIERQQELAKADHDVNAALVLYPVGDGGQVARTPFPYDQNFFANLEDQEKPLFLEMLTTQDEFPIKTVQLGSLVTLQDRVDPDHVQANVDDPPDELPLVVRVNGRNVIADGNHRLTALYVEGYKTATVRYADMNELKRQREGTAAKRFRAVKACPECGAKAGAWHKKGCSGHVLGDVEGLGKAGSADQPRDEHGRWAAGEGIDSAEAKTSHDLATEAHGELEKHMEALSDAKDRVEAAKDELKSLDDELSPDEEYQDPADQKDFEQRYDAAREEAAKATIEYHNALGALTKAANSHLENFAGHASDTIYSFRPTAKRAPEWSIEIDVTKTDEDQQLVFGWASVSSIGGEDVVDKQGDIILEDELEKAAYDFVLYCRKQGDMHERVGVGRLVESIVFTKQKQDALNIDLGMVGWFVGFKVDDPGVWKKIKDGSLPEFSIGGKAVREPVDAA